MITALASLQVCHVTCSFPEVCEWHDGIVNLELSICWSQHLVSPVNSAVQFTTTFARILSELSDTEMGRKLTQEITLMTYGSLRL